MKKFCLLVFVVALNASAISQSLSFSADTVIAYTCTNDPDVIGVIDMYNTTGSDIFVAWHIHHFDLPQDGIYALIMAGHQYIPFEDGHQFGFWEDTSQVYFYMWNDTLYAGDTSIMQIRVWDVDDSLNTVTVLTAMKVCPLTTNVNAIVAFDFQLYPNPADDLLVLKTDQQIGDLVRIADCTGRTVLELPVTVKKMSVNTGSIAPGIYALSMLNKGRVVTTRLFSKR